MRTIEIDDDVFAYLQKNAIPYVENHPNLTLRRLFKLNGKEFNLDSFSEDKRSKGRKKQKTRLPDLVRANLLREGQTLFLHDYQGKRVKGYEATISGKDLLWKGSLFSMSELAKDCLKAVGFRSDSVQGPARWYNSDGISVKELWDQFLRK